MGIMTLIFIYRNKHRNKIISVNSVSPYRTGITTEIILFLSLFLQFIFIYRNKHRNKIISVNKVSPYRTGIITEMISFLSLFLQLKICLQGQVPRLGGANKVGVYRGI